jgi:hypothetical protein
MVHKKLMADTRRYFADYFEETYSGEPAEVSDWMQNKKVEAMIDGNETTK